MRLLVVGSGSTGGCFGGRLAQAGRDVTFLVRPARTKELRRTGLRIVSPHGDAAVTPHLAVADELEEAFDVVLLAVKGFQLQAEGDVGEVDVARLSRRDHLPHAGQYWRG